MYKTVKTPNAGFNDAWKLLQLHFPDANLPNGASLDLTKPPKLIGRKVDRDRTWKQITGALIDVITIGTREETAGRSRWLHVHVGYISLGRYLFVPDRFVQF